MNNLTQMREWNALTQSAMRMDDPQNHLKELLKDRDRLNKFSLNDKNLFFDFSRQRVTSKIMDELQKLGNARNALDKFKDMVSGSVVNRSENRPALHTALRCHDPKKSIIIDGEDLLKQIRIVRDEIKEFSEKIRSGKIKGSSGDPFTDVVVIGIGGSYLGTEFVAKALSAHHKKQMNLHFLSNVDSDNFNRIKNTIPIRTTLWVIISKSYTTQETLANANLAYELLKDGGVDSEKHVVTVTAKGSPGDNPKNPVLKTFYMFDCIGGRFSVTSAVGGVPISLCFGYDCFYDFLKGAEKMDLHAQHAPIHENIPLTSALISIWNNNFLKYRTCGVIPYSSLLSKLAPHVQQLFMESCGKSVNTHGDSVEYSTGVIIFGEPGTNAQHSFFQLAHQGNPFPIEFVGVINPGFGGANSHTSGVTCHQELWANLISQSNSLATGRDSQDGERSFSGNRPSTTIIIESLSPENIGLLLAYYEAKTVFEAFIWDINPFDQFGVELGKINAGNLRHEMAKKNTNKEYKFESDPISNHYLEMLFNTELPK